MIRKFISDVSGGEYPEHQKVSAKNLSHSILEFIQSVNPQINEKSIFSKDELTRFREQYISSYLTDQLGELTSIEREVISSISQHTTLAGKLDDEDENIKLSIGERLADKVADFGGSWKFIIIFSILLMLWIILNVYILQDKGFDPYPFILLNLFLSCIAAIQAPVIMMSQNRQEDKDRQRAKKDYMINLKSEVEIHTLHEKLDHLIIRQQEDLLEAQNQQLEKLNEILSSLKSK